MDRHKSAMKRNRQNVVRKMRNRSQRSFLRNQLREMNQLLESKDLEKAKEFFPKLKSSVDKAASVGTINKNTAARYKSRISQKLIVINSSDEKLVI